MSTPTALEALTGRYWFVNYIQTDKMSYANGLFEGKTPGHIASDYYAVYQKQIVILSAFELTRKEYDELYKEGHLG